MKKDTENEQVYRIHKSRIHEFKYSCKDIKKIVPDNFQLLYYDPLSGEKKWFLVYRSEDGSRYIKYNYRFKKIENIIKYQLKSGC